MGFELLSGGALPTLLVIALDSPGNSSALSVSESLYIHVLASGVCCLLTVSRASPSGRCFVHVTKKTKQDKAKLDAKDSLNQLNLSYSNFVEPFCSIVSLALR